APAGGCWRSRCDTPHCRAASRGCAAGSRRSRLPCATPPRSGAGTASPARRTSSAPSASRAAAGHAQTAAAGAGHHACPAGSGGSGDHHPAWQNAALISRPTERRRACFVERSVLCIWPSSLPNLPHVETELVGGCAIPRDLLLGAAPLVAAALPRAAAVMRNRRAVGDRRDLQATGSQRAHGHLPAGARPGDDDLNLTHAVLHRLARGALGCYLGRIRRALARATEARAASARPGNSIALRVSERHDRVVERRLDIRSPARDVLAISSPNPR